MTPAQRESLIIKLIEDVVTCARGDSGYAGDFIRDAMREGYQPMRERTDEDLLQWHCDTFDSEYELT